MTIEPPGVETATAPGPLPLGRNRNFQLLWLGSAFSQLGLEAADVAYPLIVLALTGSPGYAGLFGMLQLLAAVFSGPVAGGLVERHGSRRTMLWAEGGRLLATGSVAVAAAAHALTLAHLLVVALVLGAAQPLGGAARMMTLRAVVADEQLTKALTQDEVRTAGAALAGPPLGGYLFSLARALPFAAVGLSFLVSACCALFLRVPVAARPGGGAPRAGRSRPESFRADVRGIAGALE